MEKYETLRLENQLCFPLYAAARKVLSMYTPRLNELGITYTQYLVFMVLWEDDGLTVGEIGRRLYLDNGTLSPVLKKLESSGYLKRERSCEDERVVRISLTEKGMELRERAADVPAMIGACIPLSSRDAAELYRLLYILLGGENDG